MLEHVRQGFMGFAAVCTAAAIACCERSMEISIGAREDADAIAEAAKTWMFQSKLGACSVTGATPPSQCRCLMPVAVCALRLLTGPGATLDRDSASRSVSCQ